MADNFVDLYQPQKMAAALQQISPPKRFFHQTFFRTAVLHDTPTLQFDLYKGKRRIAAFVNPIHDGVVVERDGYKTRETKPAYVKEARILRPADTQIRMIGENPYQPKTPRDRAAAILGQDLVELETRLVRLEEKMCADALINGKIIVKGQGWDATVDFGYEAGKNKIVLSGTDCWSDTANSDPMRDIDTWRRAIVQRCGIQPTHCIVSHDVGWAIIENIRVKEKANNMRYLMAEIAPKNLPEGVSYFGKLHLPSGTVELYSYEEWYVDPVTGLDTPLMPAGKVLLGSTEARCEFHYGMIQNLNSLQAATRFPSSWIKENGSARMIQLESAPMPNIFQVDAFLVADVMEAT
jgi:hypothetical protein